MSGYSRVLMGMAGWPLGGVVGVLMAGVVVVVVAVLEEEETSSSVESEDVI